jgi:hypothetical protein
MVAGMVRESAIKVALSWFLIGFDSCHVLHDGDRSPSRR